MAAQDEGGFVLPGVIMFVVVLTILGLSLFALSGFESQFLNTSLDRSQAFYNASGAIDRARFLLGVLPSNLESVASNLGPNVDLVVATQGLATTGPVQWNSGTPVILRARAHENGESRVVTASFDPVWTQVYDNLFSLSSAVKGLEITQQSKDWYPHLHTYLSGTIWQRYNGATWYDDIYPTGEGFGGSFQVTFGGVPAPQVEPFRQQHWNTATWAAETGQNEYHLTAPSGTIRFYKSTKAAPTDTFSLDIDTGPAVDIYVSGIVVWLFDAGFRVEGRSITVHGTTNDMLVLCATKQTKSSNHPHAGLLFNVGITSPNTPMIMVTDGHVWHDNKNRFEPRIPWLCVYADYAWIKGPEGDAPPPTGEQLIYAHPTNHAQAEDNLQKLLDQDCLPNANGQRRRLAFIPGTWADSGSSN